MNLNKHMEALFLAATFVLCAAIYETPRSLPSEPLAAPQVAQEAVQTVVIVGRRSAV